MSKIAKPHPPLLLGLNLWLLLAIVPALHEGVAGPWTFLALLVAPLALIWGLRVAAWSGWLMGVFPLGLMLPLLMQRSLAGERDLDWPLACLRGISLIAFLVSAGLWLARRPSARMQRLGPELSATASVDHRFGHPTATDVNPRRLETASDLPATMDQTMVDAEHTPKTPSG